MKHKFIVNHDWYFTIEFKLIYVIFKLKEKASEQIMRRRLKDYSNLYKFYKKILNDLVDIHEDSNHKIILNDNITHFNKVLYYLWNFTSTLFDLNKLLKKIKIIWYDIFDWRYVKAFEKIEMHIKVFTNYKMLKSIYEN